MKQAESWRRSCIASLFITQIGMAANVAFICAISVERAYSIFYPFNARTRLTIKHTRIFSTILWIVIIIHQFCVMYFLGQPKKMNYCATGTLFGKENIALIFKMPFHILSTITIAAYLSIGIYLHRKNRQQIKMTEVEGQKEMIGKKQRKTTKMLFITGGCFYIFYSVPIIILSIEWSPIVKLNIYNVSSIILIFTFMVNPIIYWQNPDYQIAYREFLHLKPRDSKRKAVNLGTVNGRLHRNGPQHERLGNHCNGNRLDFNAKSISLSTIELDNSVCLTGYHFTTTHMTCSNPIEDNCKTSDNDNSKDKNVHTVCNSIYTCDSDNLKLAVL